MKKIILFIAILNLTCSGLSTDDLTDGAFIPDPGVLPRIIIEQDSKNYAVGSIYNFGSQENATTSNSIIFTISNSGRQSLKLEGDPKINLTGDAAAMFSIVQPEKSILAQGETVTFTVTFSPLKSGGTGGKSAVIEIETNDPLNSKFILSILGESINVLLAVDARDGTLGSAPKYLTLYNNKLYFQADDGTNGVELHVYDGTTTSMVANINSTGDSSPSEFIVYNDVSGEKLYFQATDGTNGKELWVYDSNKSVIIDQGDGGKYDLCSIGSGDNPCMVADINSGSVEKDSFPKNLVVYNGKLYFSATNIDSANNSMYEEIWVYDGDKLVDKSNGDDANEYDLCSTGDNPCMLADIHSDPVNDPFVDLIVFKDKLYFQGYNGTGSGKEFWVYDGINASGAVTDNGNGFGLCIDSDNPCMVADINPGGSGSLPGGFVIYNDGTGDKLYFEANDGANGFELWVHDGAKSVTDDNGTDGVYDFCTVTDSDNPCMVADVNPGVIGSYPVNLTVFKNKLYFQANDGTNGTELHVYNGTTTSPAADIYPGTNSSFPRYLTVFDNRLYFQATGYLTGIELWVYDGTNAPVMLSDINPGLDHGSPAYFIEYNSDLYFSANDSIHGNELWRHNP